MRIAEAALRPSGSLTEPESAAAACGNKSNIANAISIFFISSSPGIYIHRGKENMKKKIPL
jgi:hypothetical protein